MSKIIVFLSITLGLLVSASGQIEQDTSGYNQACTEIYFKIKENGKQAQISTDDLRLCSLSDKRRCGTVSSKRLALTNSMEEARSVLSQLRCSGPVSTVPEEVENELKCGTQSHESGGRYWAARMCTWNPFENACSCTTYDDGAG